MISTSYVDDNINQHLNIQLHDWLVANRVDRVELNTDFDFATDRAALYIWRRVVWHDSALYAICKINNDILLSATNPMSVIMECLDKLVDELDVAEEQALIDAVEKGISNEHTTP